MIRLVGLTKRYGDFTALDDVSLDIRRGETLALLGQTAAVNQPSLNALPG